MFFSLFPMAFVFSDFRVGVNTVALEAVIKKGSGVEIFF
jgi:hypothetical protein